MISSSKPSLFLEKREYTRIVVTCQARGAPAKVPSNYRVPTEAQRSCRSAESTVKAARSTFTLALGGTCPCAFEHGRPI